MSIRRLPLPLFLLSIHTAWAAPDALPVIDVRADRIGRDAYTSRDAGRSVAEEAATIPGVRLLRQGSGSPQADLRIRGGAFSSSGFALEGLPLVNPQTEHFHADLPLIPLLAGEVRLLTGVEQFQRMAGHASGTVAVDLAEPEDHLRLGVAAGSDGYFSPSASWGWTAASAGGAAGGGTLFAQHDQLDQTDGYSDNYLDRWSGGGLLQGTDAGGTETASLLAAWSDRRFGARGFYGAPASLASEEEVSDLLLLGGVRHKSESSPARVTAAWQQAEDRYWLDRHDPGLYRNHHETDTVGLHADASPALGPAWRLPVRVDMREEAIASDYAGRLPSTGLGVHSRTRLALGATPEWSRGDWTLSAGAAGEWFDNDTPAWLPGAHVAWRVRPHHRLFAAVSSAVRQPSYTELNYDSPGSLGNQDLERQETVRFEAGWHYEQDRERAGLMVFEDQSRNVVDWTKQEAAGRWIATNLDPLTTQGLLAYASRRFGARWRLSGEYQGLDKDIADTPYASRYALDYARHEVRAGVQFDPVPSVTLGGWQTAGFWRDNPARHDGDVSLESHLQAQWRHGASGLVLTAGVANLWDEDFQTLPGQPPAGRQVYASTGLTF